MTQVKLTDTQIDKLTSLLLEYLDANDHDEEMRDLMLIMNFGEEFTKAEDKGTLKQYECIEDGERFIIEALDLKDAREKATVWNAEVIGEVK